MSAVCGPYRPMRVGSPVRGEVVVHEEQVAHLLGLSEGLEDAAQPAHDGGPHVPVGLLVGDEVNGWVLRAECRSIASQAAPAA